jgi:tellurite resistance protein
MLPDALLSLSEEQRRRIASILVLVAAVDGTLVREEMAAIESAMGAMMLHPESREEVRQLLTEPPELDGVLESMEPAAIRLALRDGALLASADGEYDEKELWILRKISAAGGLSEQELSEILDWVSQNWRVAAQGRSIIAAPMPGDEDIL